MSRRPFVAGSFYPADAKALFEELKALSPEIREDEKEVVLGAVVPHAGYLYSGRVAGEVYGRIKARKTFVIIGPNHTGMGHSFSISSETWTTPLGDAKVDTELAQAIKKEASIVKEDVSAHSQEHSIEVQLPFIKKFFPGSFFVPICVSSGDISELKAVAMAIAVSARSLGRDLAVLASSDMTHYESRQSASMKDKEAIDAILSLDALRLVSTVANEDISMCGWAPAAMMLFATRELGAVKARLIKYSDSGEVTGNISEVVGYAGVIVS